METLIAWRSGMRKKSQGRARAFVDLAAASGGGVLRFKFLSTNVGSEQSMAGIRPAVSRLTSV
jgi:hypothetical protein